MRRRLVRVVVALAAVGGFALGAAYALGAGEISSATTCASVSSCSYSATSFTIAGGQVAQFHNATISSGYSGTSHSVLANNTKTLGGKPLFVSKIIPSGATTAVNGTQYLAPGDYVFHCAIHGPSMSATLHVVGGTPKARPQLGVKVASGKLAKVRKSGKLAAKLTDSGSKASGVALKATIDGAKVAHKSGLSVPVGATKTVQLKLSKKGLKALKGEHKAQVKLVGTVAFGATATAKRTIR